ncbi:MAG: polysaccharide biosynthesis protein [Flavobacteriales bacterium]|nr:polysaccharide biosynthesis protein [Flavobacteriales bacterium]
MGLKEINTPRWVIFFIDIAICLFALSLSYLLRFNFDLTNIPPDEIRSIPFILPFVVLVRGISFYVSKIYAGIIRYTSTEDAQRIFIVISIGSSFYVLANLIRFFFIDDHFLIPFSIIIIDYMATIFIMIVARVSVKILYVELKGPKKAKANVVIYGAGESGLITKNTLIRDGGTKYNIKAFVDLDPKKTGKVLEGVKILPIEMLNSILENDPPDHFIIAVQNITPYRKKEIIDLCLKNDVRVMVVPPVSQWINGQLSFKQIKKVRIEDLLQREPIVLNEDKIGEELRNRVVLVTGAAGSIGSGLVRQISNYKPKLLILLDQAETPLFELDLEMNEKKNRPNFEIVIGDIRNEKRMDHLYNSFKPEIVFHAAAYKHVPMMENNPSEAVQANVLGTKIMVDLAIKHKVDKFVMISTDKAINPSNIMGCSKRIAEIYAQSSNTKSDTKFITSRFGNVLGSNGSVVSLFKKQIAAGGPITVTHPDITRYFMTIPEACQLVLEAGTAGNGGEIYVFNMGESVKIVDLAKKMVKLSRLELGKDIQLIFTQLRPGEKLHEELFSDQENTLPTHHSQILIAKVREYEYAVIEKEISELISLFDQQNNKAIVLKMKEIVSEYKSNNSEFEHLDKPSEIEKAKQ